MTLSGKMGALASEPGVVAAEAASARAPVTGRKPSQSHAQLVKVWKSPTRRLQPARPSRTKTRVCSDRGWPHRSHSGEFSHFEQISSGRRARERVSPQYRQSENTPKRSDRPRPALNQRPARNTGQAIVSDRPAVDAAWVPTISSQSRQPPRLLAVGRGSGARMRRYQWRTEVRRQPARGLGLRRRSTRR